jgi:glucokinase
MNILAGDAGGTQLRFAIVRAGPAEHEFVFSRSLESRDFVDFGAALDAFLAQAGDAVPELDAVSLAVAGPVESGVAHVTNLDWRIEANALGARLGIGSVWLMNDFVAAGAGLDTLPEASVATLNEGLPERHGARALIGAGTGLGQALLTWNGRGYDVYPTEGGHVDFAPRDDLEIGLLREMRGRFGRVSVERIVSGAGLTRIFDYLCSTRGLESAVIPVDASAADRARLIGETAIAREDPLCVEALGRFLSLYGAQAGNLALTCLPRGGLYVAGGIAAKVLPVLNDGEFLSAFLDKGRMRPLLEKIPVRVVLDPAVGLRGAALVASRRLLAARRHTRSA